MHVNYAERTDIQRGGIMPLSDADIQAVDQFVNHTGQMIAGVVETGASMYQENAYDERCESARDELAHSLGLHLNFDVDGMLSVSETDRPILVTPEQKAQLGLDDPENSSMLEGVVREVWFGFVATRQDVLITEVEFPVRLQSPEGITESHMRILTAEPYDGSVEHSDASG